MRRTTQRWWLSRWQAKGMVEIGAFWMGQVGGDWPGVLTQPQSLVSSVTSCDCALETDVSFNDQAPSILNNPHCQLVRISLSCIAICSVFLTAYLACTRLQLPLSRSSTQTQPPLRTHPHHRHSPTTALKHHVSRLRTVQRQPVRRGCELRPRPAGRPRWWRLQSVWKPICQRSEHCSETNIKKEDSNVY
jgi:hypothetical protein